MRKALLVRNVVQRTARNYTARVEEMAKGGELDVPPEGCEE